jgi:hypothetical protein
MRRKTICGLALVAVLVIGVCVAGCGSSSSTTTETTASISKAEFVKQGNAICAKGNKAQEAETNAYAKKHGLKENKEPTKAQQTEIVETVFVPNIQSQIDAVKALGAPSGEEQQVNAALETSQQTLNKAKANPALFFGNENLFAAAGKQLHALGLKECAPNS